MTASSDWHRELEKFRREKDEFFASAEESPIDHQNRHSFKGLRYYPPSPEYRKEVKLSRSQNPELVILATSKGSIQRFHKIGDFELEIQGEGVRLWGYKSAEREDAELFIPFRDATSGKESYGASRYLDLHFTPDDRYVIDFNYAYNPYCAYSEDYICPLAPSENWMQVAICAGEMNYQA